MAAIQNNINGEERRQIQSQCQSFTLNREQTGTERLNSDSRKPSPKAIRQRRWRRRERLGIRVVWVEVPTTTIVEMIAQGDLREGESDDVHAIGKAVGKILAKARGQSV